VLLWVEKARALSPAAVEQALDRESGLLGISGVSSDMREVLRAESDGVPRAQLALAVYLHRLAASIAAMVAALGGMDALVFTGGVGEHAVAIRARAAARLAHLGVELDMAANARTFADGDVSAPGAPVRTAVVTAREDLEMARQVRALLAARG